METTEKPAKRQRPKSVAEVCYFDKQAPAVFLALCEISNEKKRTSFYVSRMRIFRKCSIPFNRISRILGVLVSSHWIAREIIIVRLINGGMKRVIHVRLLKKVS